MAKGKKTGGRKKGTPNKANATREAAVAASGLTPIEYMLSVMRNRKKSVEVRLEAARGAAPYVHPKLASIQVTTPPGQPFETKNVGAAEPELIGAYFKRIARAADIATAAVVAAATAAADSNPGADSGVGADRRGSAKPSGG